VGIGPEDWG
jgi:hypothetical protein